MTAMVKFWMWMLFAIALSIGAVEWANSEGHLKKKSDAYVKNMQPQKNIDQLFSDLGVEASQNGMLNPCVAIENYVEKFCTPHAIQLLLSGHVFIEMEDQLMRKLLLTDYPCQGAAVYIGRICEQENFKKIFKHFAMEK